MRSDRTLPRLVREASASAPPGPATGSTALSLAMGRGDHRARPSGGHADRPPDRSSHARGAARCDPRPSGLLKALPTLVGRSIAIPRPRRWAHDVCGGVGVSVGLSRGRSRGGGPRHKPGARGRACGIGQACAIMNLNEPSSSYHHTQRGQLVWTVLVVVAVVEGMAMLVWYLADGPSADLLIVALALALLLTGVYVLAGSLSVTVDQHQLRMALGSGLVRRSIPLSEIKDCRPVRNSWWYGWGIRLTPRGWLWNVSGLDAVELTYVSGKHFRIGTDEPQLLSDAIDAGIRREARGSTLRRHTRGSRDST